jgi:predicted transposase/invertase (TIGR01784 family)
MQKEDQEFFKDRSLYYSAYPIREQGWKGKDLETGALWDFELKTVYFFGILDFIFDKTDPDPLLICKASFKDQRGREIHEKLQFIYIQMPLFHLKEAELETRCDKWLFFLKYLPSFNHIPTILNEQVFEKAFKTAEVAEMSQAERDRYEQESNDYLAYWATLDTREKKGRAEGRAEGKAEGQAERSIEIARSMKSEGFDSAMIAKITGLSPETIERLDGV